MPDPFSRARRYLERAAECRRLASLTSADTRAEYADLASQYEDIAQTELSVSDAKRSIRSI
jgi:hypothetical protein